MARLKVSRANFINAVPLPVTGMLVHYVGPNSDAEKWTSMEFDRDLGLLVLTSTKHPDRPQEMVPLINVKSMTVEQPEAAPRTAAPQNKAGGGR